jgi:hypothetical protein
VSWRDDATPREKEPVRVPSGVACRWPELHQSGSMAASQCPCPWAMHLVQEWSTSCAVSSVQSEVHIYRTYLTPAYRRIDVENATRLSREGSRESTTFASSIQGRVHSRRADRHGRRHSLNSNRSAFWTRKEVDLNGARLLLAVGRGMNRNGGPGRVWLGLNPSAHIDGVQDRGGLESWKCAMSLHELCSACVCAWPAHL